MDDGKSDRYIQLVGEAIRADQRNLVDFDINPVLRGNDVSGINGLAADAGRVWEVHRANRWLQFMLENSAKRSEIDTIRLIEVEIFVAGAHKNPSLAESFSPISQYGPKARGFLTNSIGKDESGDR